VITLVEYPASVNLRRLLSVRSMLFAALAVLTALVGVAAGVALPLEPIAAIIGALAAVTLFSWLRLAGGVRAVRPLELPLQLGIDIAALTGLLYFTGGWTNPLVSLYLVPIAVASAMLTARLAWTVAVAAVLSYAFIAQFYRPLLPSDDAMAGTFTLHVLGMWVTFVVAAALIAYFGTTMAATLRTRAQALASARETNLRNEQIIGVATLAAGTAHELSTPLSSIAVSAGELRDSAQPAQRAEIDLIVDQIEVCKDILRRLRAAATPAHDARTDTQPVGAFIDEVRERFQLLRPTVNARFGCDRATGPRIAADPTLRQAVLNLLNNAADASPLSVECTAHSTDRHLVLDIRDRGNGFDVAGSDPVEAPFDTMFTNGGTQGMGIGLMLANATIERMGGSVHITDRDGGGAWVRVTLPLSTQTVASP
jgi:two-component system, sensor histidine kinase RegB